MPKLYQRTAIAMNDDEQRNKFGHSCFYWIFAVQCSADTLFVQSQLFLRMNKAQRPCDKGRSKFRTSHSFETAASSFSVLVLLALPISVSEQQSVRSILSGLIPCKTFANKIKRKICKDPPKIANIRLNICFLVTSARCTSIPTSFRRKASAGNIDELAVCAHILRAFKSMLKSANI